ncbi:MAG: aryl-sulfate sulfotransferase [Planctomycetia bacterium]|nr:aryl-sulfate sulfotransferase [Planctomycetia bacterium]
MLAQTTGLFFNNPGTEPGYVLFSPNTATTTYLIGRDGGVVNQWQSAYSPGLLGYLLPDGSIIRDAAPHGQGGNGSINAAGAGGLLERIDWNGTKTWQFAYDSPTYLAHHDFKIMPNGNILLIAWELKSEAQATLAGRDPNLPGPGYLYPDSIVEVQPDYVNGGGTIVWEWHIWDHLVQQFDATKSNWYGPTGVADHPELINLNYVSDPANGGGAPEDWTHANGIDYNADLDQIVLSSREFSEFWIIDHSTTTAQAASHTGGRSGRGGDLLYRWGNPQAYNRGTANDRMLYFQHDPQWIPDGVPGAGDITVFNNGFGRPGTDYTSVEEITTPTPDANGNYPLTAGQAYGPATTTWTYNAPLENFSPIISGAQRLPNGNTLVDFGVNGTFIEVTQDGTQVWKYVNPYTGGGTLGPMDPIPSLNLPPPLLSSLRTNFTFQAIQYPLGYFDVVAPRVTSVQVGSTQWRNAFRNQLTAANLGSADGYEVPGGANQLKTLPWSNLNQIVIQFSEDVSVQAEDLVVQGANVPLYDFSSFSYDAENRTGIWTLAAPIDRDNVTLHLDGASAAGVRDLVGNLLDGEWTSGLTNYPSGNGTKGGNLDFQFRVLPGDFNQDSSVNISDIQQIALSWLQGDPLHDGNGDGLVDISEIQLVAAKWLTALPGSGAGVGGGAGAAAAPLAIEPVVAASVATRSPVTAEATASSTIAGDKGTLSGIAAGHGRSDAAHHRALDALFAGDDLDGSDHGVVAALSAAQLRRGRPASRSVRG